MFAGWKDGQRGTDRKLTVSLSAFGKKEDQQLPDEPNPDNEKEKDSLREAVGLNNFRYKPRNKQTLSLLTEQHV